MTDEPINIEFTTNADAAAQAVESISAALAKISPAAQTAGQGIDTSTSDAIAALQALNAQINELITNYQRLGAMSPTAGAALGAGEAAAATPVESVMGAQRGAATYVGAGATGDEYANLFATIHAQAGPEAAAEYARSIGSSYEEMAAKAGIATQATEQLSQAQQQAAPAAQELAAAQASAATPLGGNVKTLGDLRRELNDAKAAYTGDEESTRALTNASKAYDDALKGANDAMGKTRTLGDQISSMFERQVIRIGIGIAIWSTLRTAQQEIQKTIQAMEEYSTEVARFASITDQSIGDAVQQYNALRDAAAQRGFTPTEAAPGIQAASRFEKNPQAQQELYGAAAQLSEVMGLKDTTEATNALGAAMLSTGKSAKELANLVYTGFKEMGGDPQQFMNSLASVQALADETGGDFEKMFMAVAHGAEASGRSMDTVYQTLNKFAQNIDNLSGDKFVRFVDQMRSVAGVNPLNADNTLKSVDEILTAISAKWDSYSPQIQSKILEVLSGGKLRGTAESAGRALMEAYGQGATDVSTNVLDQATNNIESAFGRIMARTRADVEALREQGYGVQAFLAEQASSILPSVAGLLGGAPRGGALAAENFTNMLQLGVGGGLQKSAQQMKEQMTGMSREDARQYMRDAMGGMGSLGSFVTGGFNPFGNVSDADIDKQIAAMGIKLKEDSKTIGAAAGSALGDAFARGFKVVSAAITDTVKKSVSGTADSGAVPANTPLEDLRMRLSLYAQNPQTEQYPLPTAATDLTKMSQDEINQAKQLSVQLSNQELESLRQEMIALGMEKKDIDAAVAAREAELNATTKLLETQQGLNYETGKQVAYLEKAASQIKSQKQEQESNFAFQRLRNVDPGQFPELQARAQMYNQFLTNIGDPEKPKNINLLLGEDNVFKTMNVRMTALQMALEDLTKTEKAQLSGTWNLPAGATALVPISSLDLQRWNKSEGGGLSADALRALMNATGQSGDKVSDSMQTAATRIINAIKEEAMKSGLPMGKISQAQTIPEAVSAVRETLLAQGRLAETRVQQAFDIMSFKRPTTEPTMAEVRRADASRPSVMLPDTAAQMTQQRHGPAAALHAEAMQQSGGSSLSTAAQTLNTAANSLLDAFSALAPQTRKYNASDWGLGDTKTPDALKMPATQVQVSALPIKANFNADISIMLNGAVVARALMPIMYQMLAKMTASTGTRPKGTQR